MSEKIFAVRAHHLFTLAYTSRFGSPLKFLVSKKQIRDEASIRIKNLLRLVKVKDDVEYYTDLFGLDHLTSDILSAQQSIINLLKEYDDDFLVRLSALPNGDPLCSSCYFGRHCIEGLMMRNNSMIVDPEFLKDNLDTKIISWVLDALVSSGIDSGAAYEVTYQRGSKTYKSKFTSSFMHMHPYNDQEREYVVEALIPLSHLRILFEDDTYHFSEYEG